jgi:mxaA protein
MTADTRRIVVLAALLLAAAAVPVAGAPTDLVQMEVDTPRAYGYVIGDTITHTVRLELGPGYALDAEALPVARRLDQWLELRSPVLRRRAEGIDVLLTYQLVNAPAATTQLTVPRVTLQIVGNGRALPVFVPEWSFTAAPLVPEEQRGPAAGYNLRPERMPPLRPLAPELWRLGLLLAGALVLGGVLGWLHVGLPWRARRARPFAQALRRLERMRGRAWDEASMHEALSIVHFALDAAAGRTVLGSNADVLFRARPALERVRPALESFLAGSRSTLFDPDAEGEPPTLGSLATLCRACRDAERAVP